MLTSLSVDRFLSNKPLAITPGGLEELRGHIYARLAAFDAAPRDFLANVASDMRAAAQARPAAARGVGVIEIRGAISQHARGDISSMLFGGATVDGITAALREFMRDPEVGKIVLDIDSPGGSSAGIAALANDIRTARRSKPIVAVANSLAASAAYWIGSAASEFYASPGALVGSVGCYLLHMDFSEHEAHEGIKPTFIAAGDYKVEGNEFEPLSDDARAHMQSIVDDCYRSFIADVAKGRRVSEATVKSGYGKGRVLTASAAKSAGMIEGIRTLEEAISRDAQTRNSESAETAPESLGEASETEEVTPEVDEEGRKRLAWIRLEALMERVPV